jgi:dimethylargininase
LSITSNANIVRALQQHRDYCQVLRACGVLVRTLDVNHHFPDCAFIEDVAIVLDEVAVLASMGAESRRLEPAGLESELRQYRPVFRVAAPATIEGGDVLVAGRTLFVGLSSRTNVGGITALEAIVRPYGYTVVPVPVRGCLHLKTGCTALDDRRLLVNPGWLDVQALKGWDLIPVPEEEPWAANTLMIDGRVCLASAQVRTVDMLGKRGFDVRPIDLSEFAKAEGGVTCLSLVFCGEYP